MEFQFQFDWQAAINAVPYLLKGIPYTLLISFGGLAIGFVLGIIFGLLSINKKMVFSLARNRVHRNFPRHPHSRAGAVYLLRSARSGWRPD